MKRTEISYGVYLYGWSVAQTIVYAVDKYRIRFRPLEPFAMTMAGTGPLALASWHFAEHPALRLKKAKPVGTSIEISGSGSFASL